ncbi:hypothetical protein [Dactylosporangium sp. NPDC048998]|uniref:hypothetical protein n=1 Tax=Dactylosporangium sp. NPDC048998 TaxID=3363976 RepID=UPI00371D5259
MRLPSAHSRPPGKLQPIAIRAGTFAVADCHSVAEARDRTSSLSTQRYTYDSAGRITTVDDTVSGACTTRVQGYNTASDRTSLTTYGPATGGACQTTTALGTTGWTYDNANVCKQLNGVTIRATFVKKYHWITGPWGGIRYAYPLTPRCN